MWWDTCDNKASSDSPGWSALQPVQLLWHALPSAASACSHSKHGQHNLATCCELCDVACTDSVAMAWLQASTELLCSSSHLGNNKNETSCWTEGASPVRRCCVSPVSSAASHCNVVTSCAWEAKYLVLTVSSWPSKQMLRCVCMREIVDVVQTRIRTLHTAAHSISHQTVGVLHSTPM